MQSMNSTPARNSIANTKVSVPQGGMGKGLGLGDSGYGVNEGQNNAVARPGDKRAIEGFTNSAVKPGKV